MTARKIADAMLVGDKSIFAIESGITRAYEGAGFHALGFIVIYVGGCRYGIHSPDAAMLAGPLGAVKERIARRGSHIVPFATEPDAGKIADAVSDAIYAPNQENIQFFNVPQPVFYKLIHSSHISWAGELDEAFDDLSYLLQFDVKDRVRLIAFKSRDDGYHHDPITLNDVWLEADKFYGILAEWTDAFEAEWMRLPKLPQI